MSLPLKYKNLITMSQVVAVPPLICLNHDDLEQLLVEFRSFEQQLEHVYEKISLTSGAFLSEHLAEFDQILNQVEWGVDADRFLEERLCAAFGEHYGVQAFAVRSASVLEDLSSQSFAGLYKTELNVKGLSSVKDAILEVWKSGYSRSALVERLNAGRSPSTFQMNVIVQTMVSGVLAGVAFSRDPVNGESAIVIEYVEGLGDKLVSGEVRGSIAKYVAGQWTVDHPPAGLTEVVTLVEKTQSILGSDLDIEWSWDGQTLWLLQARPITTFSSEQLECSETPVWIMAHLYDDTDEVLSQFAPLPEFAAYFRQKRKSIYDFAKRHHINRGAALLLKFNISGLTLNDHWQQLSENFSSSNVILDFSDHIRQLILDRDRLSAELESLATHKTQVYTVVIRDFIAGDLGLITRALPSDDDLHVFCECSTDGLLAINRGTAHVKTLDLSRGQTAMGLTAADLQLLQQATISAQAELGPVQIEWVFANSCLYAIDFSVVSHTSLLPSNSDIQVISEGYVQGPLVFINDNDADLVALSVAPAISLTRIPDAVELGYAFEKILAQINACDAPPILVVSRPYAVLASLLQHAAGFLFEEASMLCHLAILLREKRIPAVHSTTLYRNATQHNQMVIDTRADAIASLFNTSKVC